MTDTTLTAQQSANCTCPSGDGSLCWPCPAHPPVAQQSAPDLDKLEALAYALRGLRWNEPTEGTNDNGGRYREVMTEEGDEVFGEFSGPDRAEADFIAAANPAAVLDLIALARRAAPAQVEAAPRTHDERLTLIRNHGDQQLIQDVQAGRVSIHAAVKQVESAPPTDWREVAEALEESYAADSSLDFMGRAAKIIRFYAQPAQACSAQVATACTVPPEGWHCTRAAGHQGPCAALPSDDTDDFTLEQEAIYQRGVEDGKLIARGMARLKAGIVATGAEGAQQQTDDELDFTPDAHHTVNGMANVGYDLMQTLKALRPDFSWSRSPAEIVGVLIDELAESAAAPAEQQIDCPECGRGKTHHRFCSPKPRDSYDPMSPIWDQPERKTDAAHKPCAQPGAGK